MFDHGFCPGHLPVPTWDDLSWRVRSLVPSSANLEVAVRCAPRLSKFQCIKKPTKNRFETIFSTLRTEKTQKKDQSKNIQTKTFQQLHPNSYFSHVFFPPGSFFLSPLCFFGPLPCLGAGSAPSAAASRLALSASSSCFSLGWSWQVRKF